MALSPEIDLQTTEAKVLKQLLDRFIDRMERTYYYEVSDFISERTYYRRKEKKNYTIQEVLKLCECSRLYRK